jgi:hypothetical protein
MGETGAADTTDLWDSILWQNLDGSGIYNVLNYSADNTGATDASGAIRNAIAAVPAGGGVVYIPPGTYRIDTPITGGVDGIRIVGAGRRTQLLNDAALDVGTGILTIPDGIRGYSIEHLYFKSVSGRNQGPNIVLGSDSGEIRIVDVEMYAYGASAGISCVGSSGIHVYMENVRINGGTNCFYFHPTPVTINNLTAVSCYANDARTHGFSLNNVNLAVLVGCSADNCGQDTPPGYGFRFEGTRASCIGCTCENNGVTATSTGGGFSVAGGTTYSFIDCATYNQGNDFEINASGASVTLVGCQTSTPIPFGNSLTLTSYTSVTVSSCSFVNLAAVTALKHWFGGLVTTGTTASLHGATPATQIAHVADAKVNYTTGDLDSEAEVISAFNTTNGKINTILASLETLGLHALS